MFLALTSSNLLFLHSLSHKKPIQTSIIETPLFVSTYPKQILFSLISTNIHHDNINHHLMLRYSLRDVHVFPSSSKPSFHEPVFLSQESIIQ
mmetsp:Transcript_5738/g.11108  ORF Transcript_5738/g.11108 Transcript_5738/m.11108 type:complete len:92 (-) Transcript_5738:1273-1548(-)